MFGALLIIFGGIFAIVLVLDVLLADDDDYNGYNEYVNRKNRW